MFILSFEYLLLWLHGNTFQVVLLLRGYYPSVYLVLDNYSKLISFTIKMSISLNSDGFKKLGVIDISASSTCILLSTTRRNKDRNVLPILCGAFGSSKTEINRECRFTSSRSFSKMENRIEYFLFILAFKKFQTQDINLLEKKNNVIHKRTTKIESTLFMSLRICF